MKKASSERFSIALFNSAVAVSSISMLWLLWHFPIATLATALIVVAGVALVAKLAKLHGEPAHDVGEPKPTA
jgi:hypothetical protein